MSVCMSVCVLSRDVNVFLAISCIKKLLGSIASNKYKHFVLYHAILLSLFLQISEVRRT